MNPRQQVINSDIFYLFQLRGAPSLKMDFTKSRELIEDLTEDILDIRIGGENGILKSLETLNIMLLAHEEALSKLETHSKDAKTLEKYEKELLDQFKQHDRLLHMINMNNPSAGSTNMAINRNRILKREALLGKDSTQDQSSTSNDSLPDSELLQLQDRIVKQQDYQLDSLSQVLGRQKKIGELIGQTLDEQVDMLDQVDERVDRVQSGIGSASSRVGAFMAASASDSSLCYTIVFLFLILILVIYLTRLL